MSIIMIVLAGMMTGCSSDGDKSGSSSDVSKGKLTGTSWLFIGESIYPNGSGHSYTYTLRFTKEGIGTHTKDGWQRRTDVWGTVLAKEYTNEVTDITYTYDAKTREGIITEWTRQSFYVSPDYQKLTWGNNIYSRK